MAERSLEEKLDQLYAADPDDFVALRKQLQAELRAAGMKAEAALLARARRPTTSMGAVNQMVRRRPEVVDALLERSERLRAAQSSGDRDAMRDAIRGHRAALADAGAAADDVLGARATEAFREEIRSVLHSASTQRELGEELRAGRLVRPDDMTPGFPELDVAAADPAARPARASKRERDESDAREERGQHAAREAEQKEARRRLDGARAADAAATAAVDAAQRRVEELTDELTTAREQLRDARSLARTAAAESARLNRLLERGSSASR
jgi:hypothetical protein